MNEKRKSDTKLFMELVKRVRTLHILFLSIGIIYLILLLVPLLWSDTLSIKYDKFTEEWYKQCLDIGKILFGFFIGTLLYNRYGRVTELKKTYEIKAYYELLINYLEELYNTTNEILISKRISDTNLEVNISNMLEYYYQRRSFADQEFEKEFHDIRVLIKGEIVDKILILRKLIENTEINNYSNLDDNQVELFTTLSQNILPIKLLCEKNYEQISTVKK